MFFVEAAHTLARFEIPLFVGWNEEEVWEAFNDLFRVVEGTNKEEWDTWLSWFQEQIHALSNEQVTLERHNFYTGTRGQGITFLLKKEGKQQKIEMGSYFPPFSSYGYV